MIFNIKIHLVSHKLLIATLMAHLTWEVWSKKVL